MTTIEGAFVQQAGSVAEHAAARARIVIRPLTTMVEMTAACELFDQVWGVRKNETSEIQPALLRALEHSGSYVIGAFGDGRMIAASVAFLAAPIGRGLHSHITGVLPSRAGSGIGAAIKWHQRSWALMRGIDTVTWTYDPLIARNSFFNIARLGARPMEYLIDFYGLMTDGLNAGQPSDRAVAVWDLKSAVVAERAAGHFGTARLADLLLAGAQQVLTADSAGRPEIRPGQGDVLLLAVPRDIEALRRRDPAGAMRWRLALRDTLGSLIADPGWQVTDFLSDGWYVLSRNETGAA